MPRTSVHTHAHPVHGHALSQQPAPCRPAARSARPSRPARWQARVGSRPVWARSPGWAARSHMRGCAAPRPPAREALAPKRRRRRFALARNTPEAPLRARRPEAQCDRRMCHHGPAQSQGCQTAPPAEAPQASRARSPACPTQAQAGIAAVPTLRGTGAAAH